MFTTTSLVVLSLLSAEILAQTRQAEHPDWPRNRSRIILDYMQPTVDTALLKPLAFDSCISPGLLWIFVVTAPWHFEERAVLRSTWANPAIFNESSFELIHKDLEEHYVAATDPTNAVQVTFVVGTTQNSSVQRQIEEEHQQFGDMLQENFVDSYQNLTLKTLFILKWTNLSECVRNCKFRVTEPI